MRITDLRQPSFVVVLSHSYVMRLTDYAQPWFVVDFFFHTRTPALVHRTLDYRGTCTDLRQSVKFCRRAFTRESHIRIQFLGASQSTMSWLRRMQS